MIPGVRSDEQHVVEPAVVRDVKVVPLKCWIPRVHHRHGKRVTGSLAGFSGNAVVVQCTKGMIGVGGGLLGIVFTWLGLRGIENLFAEYEFVIDVQVLKEEQNEDDNMVRSRPVKVIDENDFIGRHPADRRHQHRGRVAARRGTLRPG